MVIELLFRSSYLSLLLCEISYLGHASFQFCTVSYVSPYGITIYLGVFPVESVVVKVVVAAAAVAVSLWRSTSSIGGKHTANCWLRRR